MKICDLLSEKKLTDVEVIRENCTLRETAHRLVLHQIGVLVVVDQNRTPIGMISERDLIRAITEYDARLLDKHVSELMSRPLITCRGKDSIFDALSVMKSKAIRHLPIIDEGELAGIVSMRDLTQACEILQIQASTDPLTGLPNRRSFYQALANELDRSNRYGHPLTVVLFDIDHFKNINDTYGHSAGDDVLQSLAIIAKANIRSIDLVARLGGEEFVVLMPETDRSGAMVAGEKLRAKIADVAIISGEHQINVSASFGVTGLNHKDESAEVLINRADKAMYKAKKDGRNRIVFIGDDAVLSDVV